MERTEALATVGELAADQWGLVTTAQAQAAGVSRVNLTRLVDAELLRHAGRGVYQVVGAAPTAHEEIKVAWLRLDPGTPAWRRTPGDARSGVVSHASACRLHNLGDIPADSVEISVPLRRTTRDREVVLYVLTLGSEDITVVDGLPVTTVERTIVDLLKARTDAGHVGRVLADADQRGLVDTSELAARVAPYARAYGLGRDADGEALLRALADQAEFVLRADTLTPAGERAVAATAALMHTDAVARAVGQQQALANAINAMSAVTLQPLHDAVNAAGADILGPAFNALNAVDIHRFDPLYSALSAIEASNNDVLRSYPTLPPALGSILKDVEDLKGIESTAIPTGLTRILDDVRKMYTQSGLDVAGLNGLAGIARAATRAAAFDVDTAALPGITGDAKRAAEVMGTGAKVPQNSDGVKSARHGEQSGDDAGPTGKKSSQNRNGRKAPTGGTRKKRPRADGSRT